MGFPDQKRQPCRFHILVAGLLCAAGTALLWYGLSRRWHWLPWLLCWLAAINVVAFGYYGWDKRCAVRGRRRVPERVLHGLSLAGGSVGAFAAMHLFRHKTIKGPFRILFWSIVVIQVTACVWLLAEFGYLPLTTAASP